MSYTPGPWHVSFHGSENCWIVDAGKESAIAKVTKYQDDANTQQANFRLIAAAPELLEALQELLFLYEHDEGCREITEYKRAKAAIAKATGTAK